MSLLALRLLQPKYYELISNLQYRVKQYTEIIGKISLQACHNEPLEKAAEVETKRHIQAGDLFCFCNVAIAFCPIILSLQGTSFLVPHSTPSSSVLFFCHFSKMAETSQGRRCVKLLTNEDRPRKKDKLQKGLLLFPNQGSHAGEGMVYGHNI